MDNMPDNAIAGKGTDNKLNRLGDAANKKGLLRLMGDIVAEGDKIKYEIEHPGEGKESKTADEDDVRPPENIVDQLKEDMGLER